MAMLAELFEKRESLGNPSKWLQEWFAGGRPTLSGTMVNEKTSMNVPTVFSCVNGIATDVAKLGVYPYKRIPGRGKELIEGHALVKLLNRQPNPEMSAIDFRSAIQSHVLLWGNGYSYIQRDNGDKVQWLHMLRPDRTSPHRMPDGTIWYEVRDDNGQSEWFNSHEILHIRGLGFDGICGYSVISLARETIGLAAASEQYGAAFYGNGSMPGGVLEHPGKLSKEAQQRLVESWSRTHQGPSKAWKLRVLEEGMKYNPLTMPNNEAQFLETREFSIEDICRFFRYPPQKAGHFKRAQGWSTLEASETSYMTDCLLPWLIRWEQWIDIQCFGESEQSTCFMQHAIDEVLRADMKTRADSDAVAVNAGWKSRQECRIDRNMNTVEGLDDFLVPLNMQTLAQSNEPDPEPVESAIPPEPQSTGEGDDAQRNQEVVGRLGRAYMPVVVDALTRMVRKENKALAAAAHKPETITAWSQDYYHKHRSIVAEALTPAMTSYVEAVLLSAGAEWYRPHVHPETIAAGIAEQCCQVGQREASILAGDPEGAERAAIVLASKRESVWVAQFAAQVLDVEGKQLLGLLNQARQSN